MLKLYQLWMTIVTLTERLIRKLKVQKMLIGKMKKLARTQMTVDWQKWKLNLAD